MTNDPIVDNYRQAAEAWLMHQFGPTLSIDDMAAVFRQNRSTVSNNLGSGRLPIPTYREGARRVAAVVDVAAYLERRRQQALEEHEEA